MSSDVVAKQEEPIYENDHYVVETLYLGEDAEPYVDGKFVYRVVYAVTNKTTEVMEHVCVQLPEAIYTAAGLDAALTKAPWNWAKEAVDAASVN